METAIVNAFDTIGARVKLQMTRPARGPWNRRRENRFFGDAVRVDIQHDQHGAYFDISRRVDVVIKARDMIPEDRHLLLTVEAGPIGRSAFLCGHDEREWFAAAIPESADALTVQQAKDALKPQEVWDAIKRFGVPMEDRDRRVTAGFVRQGEWFFIPCPGMEVHWDQLLYNEPIQRGAGKPHLCEMMYRQDGVTVYVSPEHPNGLTRAQWLKLPHKQRRLFRWQERVRDAEVYVRGQVSHHDHDAIELPFWHKVVMNTETRSRAMRNLAFLD